LLNLVHPKLLTGISRTYEPNTEDGEKLPPEVGKVRTFMQDVLVQFAEISKRELDIVATKDYANRNTAADVVVNGEIIMQNAPTPYLLYLEKFLDGLRQLVEKFPTLDPAFNWTYDQSARAYVTPPTQTSKTKKVKRVLLLHAPTDRHPAQTQAYDDDVIVGTWTKRDHSGAMPAHIRKLFMDRIETLHKAVKFAREEANSIEAPEIHVGDAIMDFILRGTNV
jgi:hypothetical protein